MRILAGDTWTLEELEEQVADAGRRGVAVPPADSKRAVLEKFGEVLGSPEDYEVNLDGLNDSLHEFADSIADKGNPPVTLLWQVAAPFRSDRSFGIICEILQDAERYAGNDLAVTAVLL